MRSRVVLWQVALALLISRVIGFRIFGQRRIQMPMEMSCFDVPMKVVTLTTTRIKNDALNTPRKLSTAAASPTEPTPAAKRHDIVKRFDRLFPEENIVKEHAKLVQDINSLRQVVFVSPFADEPRDYDDSVYHEVIETSSTGARASTTTARPPPPPPRVRSTGPPVLLLGGASQRQSVRAPAAFRVPRPTISLVGSSMTPLGRHPYPFVGQATSQKPYKVCMPTVPIYPAVHRPSLWTRLLSLFPRLTG